MEVFGVLVPVGARKYFDIQKQNLILLIVYFPIQFFHVLIAFTTEYLAPNILLPVSPISIVPWHAATLGDRQTFSASEKSRAE